MPVAIPGAKPRAILTMLGLHDGSVVPADALVKLLWGNDPPRTAGKALQTHISALRRALGDGFVVTEGAGWRLDGAEVDASRYKSAAKTGRDAAAVGDTSQAVASLEEALVLWRGIPELPDGQRGLSEKTRWIESHAALVEDRADALLATGRAAEVIGDLEAAVAEAPLRERRWGQLMLALYRAGRQGEALGAYQRVRSLLADELGVDPGPELRRLETAIIAQDSSLDVAVTQHLPSVTRAVTFLLTDIEGSTAAWEADAGGMAVALARHDELVEQVVTSRGGRLIKTRGEGDATFSVFERPSAAAAAAIELQDAITHEPWASVEPIRVRMALHTGEVELRNGDYFGRAVNRVARLRSLADGGQILCSGATAELVIDSLADDVMLNDLGTRQLKNLARPEHVFELRLETAAAQPQPQTAEPPMERPGLPAVLVGPGPFVGRSRELERLLSVWQTALAGGVPTVLIAGEPGVGKTRLAGEWSQQAYAQGAIVLYGRCDEDLGAPYQPFAEALRSLVPCMGADRLRGLRGVEALLPLAPGLTDVLPDLVSRAHPDPDTERYALFDAVVALLEIASKSAPVLLILDDLHWAAKPTLLLLRHLLRFGDHARVQIVGTYRSTDLDRSHPLAAMLADLHRGAPSGTASRLSLSGLDEDDVTAYVAEAGYDDEELAHALATVTGGNPFFLIEALRHVDESGGVWDQSTLPQGVREAVSRRLSRLPVETNKALAAAAVVGSRFALELVEQVVGDDLIDAFDEACQAGIVIEEPGGNYRFNHAIVRQSLLAELASVRRMRLHQRIAATLETRPGADDELLAELAHHYFECAWAGNAAKAVFYCRRAADQAMARLAYEGAADLYHQALHALEEIDDELPDRDAQAADLLVARCEALLAAGDVTSAAGAVAQLQQTTVDSARFAAWAACFDGQLSLLIHPERLDEAESALSAAAAKLAQLDDAAGEAKAHTVRAGCLARLGRIADCEIALDDALTAARRAREHRSVNAVLAGAPLAALWGPNPVPRAGGRCLDVVRLLRITTDSPAVEATSTRCQAVLEAFRGRAAAARRMIDSARRTVTELGLRHARLEVEQFAGIVELIVNDPAAAEPHLRKAYNGFRRMGLDADTAETAALLGRACLALDRVAEADELCTESERLAGHALKASMGWRTLRAHLLARGGDHEAARQVAEAAVALAERTDALVDHGDACLTLATVLAAAGNTAGARAAAEQAVALYERKGAAALAELARGLLGEQVVPITPPPTEAPHSELDSECVRVGERVMAAIQRRDWDEFERLFAPDVLIQSRRKIVGLTAQSAAMRREMRRELETGAIRISHVMVAARGERLALSRLVTSTADASPGAPQDELLQLYAINENGKVALQIWFDVEDIDVALAELDAMQAQFERDAQPQAPRPENAAARAFRDVWSHMATRDWDAMAQSVADNYVGIDHRRVVSAETQHSRDVVIRDLQAASEVGFTISMVNAVAVRGERLVLAQTRACGNDPEAAQNDALNVVEIDADDRIATVVTYDLEDFDAAIAELDARYVAGDAAPYGHTWSTIAESFASIRRGDMPATTPDCASVDHRRAAAFAPGELVEYVRAGWELDQHINPYFESVQRINSLGAVVTFSAHGGSREGFDAEWRGVSLSTVDGDKINRCEIFDETDLDAALARFEQLTRPAPRLENAATLAFERFRSQFAARDWEAIAETLAENAFHDDRRLVVGVGVRAGRDAVIAEMSALAEIGVKRLDSNITAIRGGRLLLNRSHASGHDQRPDSFRTDVLNIVEINADGRITALITFDPDNIEAAVTELESRYLAGEAASYSTTWSTIARSYTSLNRGGPPVTTEDWVNIDHRRGSSFPSGELPALLDLWKSSTAVTNFSFIEAAHRLSNLGAVISSVSHEISAQGVDAEWRTVDVFTVEGTLIDRLEVFDEADLAAAIARFEQLSRPATRPENAASQVAERFLARFAAHDWDALAGLIADDFFTEDRRRLVGVAARRGREAEIASMRVVAELGGTNMTSTVVATRGTRLILTRLRYADWDQAPGAFHTDVLDVIEIDADDRISRRIVFDADDIEGALAELDARYLAGEAAAHALTWSVIAREQAGFNRHELAATTPDVVYVDRRPVVAIEGVDLAAAQRAAWDVTPEANVYVEAVHRLSELGAVITQAVAATSPEGFDAEWRIVVICTVQGGLICRYEVFDETDLDAALARFDELHPPARRLENAASRMADQFLAHFAARDWSGLYEALADNFCSDDRRRVVGAGVRHGRDAQMADIRSIADVGTTHIMSKPIALRGQRLVLTRGQLTFRDHGADAYFTESFSIVEIDAEDRIVALVSFDLEDLDAAYEELERRYLAGEAAPYARVWQMGIDTLGEANRHQPGPMMRQIAYTDHRRVPFAPGDFAHAVEELWSLVPDARYRTTVAHALDTHGIVSGLVIEGSDEHGNQLQWARTLLFVADGPQLEVYEEDDIDAALARFEELRPTARRLENAATRADKRFVTNLGQRNWSAVANALAADSLVEDRRHVVNAGIWHGREEVVEKMKALAVDGGANTTLTVIATRGERLALSRFCSSNRELRHGEFGVELLSITEIDSDERILACVAFDPDNMDAAFAELDARYLAGEAASHSSTWSTIARIYAGFNTHELPPTTRNWVYADHRSLVSTDTSDLPASTRAGWDLMPHVGIYIEVVHQLDDLGAVVTARNVSRTDIDAEWRTVNIFTIDGSLMTRCELFDEADLDAALARLEELQTPTRRLDNMASPLVEHFQTHYAARDWHSMSEILAADISVDDRRRGVNAGIQLGRDAAIDDLRASVQAGFNNSTSTIVATRGEHLALTRVRMSDGNQRPEAFQINVFHVLQVNAQGRTGAVVIFDVEDIDAAFAELDARYLAGEAASQSRTWSAITRVFEVLNRGELPTTAQAFEDVDHRRGVMLAPGDLMEFLHAAMGETKQSIVYVEAVHRLTGRGAVVTHVAQSTTPDGFYAEWRMADIFMVEGDLINRYEFFEETDLDAALARFEELQEPTQQPENEATRIAKRFPVYMTTRDWDGMADILAADVSIEDRRPGANAGIRRGRKNSIDDMRAAVEVGFTHITSKVVATRGNDIALMLVHASGSGPQDPDAFRLDIYHVVEIDSDGRTKAVVVFDSDDIDAAFAELDARYLAGEGAAHAHTWSIVAEGYAALNRGDIPPTTADFADTDHRSGATMAPGDLIDYLRVAFDETENNSLRIVTVHRLNDHGAVVTHVAKGTTPEGLDAEWRVTNVITIDGNLLNRVEMFDESDLDAALARFDELARSVPMLVNDATKALAQFAVAFNRRDMAGMLALASAEGRVDDRREDLRAVLEVRAWQTAAESIFETVSSSWQMEHEAIAVRGSRLSLSREHYRDLDQADRPVVNELLRLVDLAGNDLLHDSVVFDSDDMAAAFAELDARYLAGEGAAHAHTWSIVAEGYAALNRGEMPLTTNDFVDIDHRRLTTMGPGDLMPYLRAALADSVGNRLDILAVHRLTELGAVVTHVAKGTSREGFYAEWRMTSLYTVAGDLINHCEMFDESDLDAALARFDELAR
ncbi:BTAD domain-containing putative transcriptional regulator [Mycobacterium sp. pR1184]|uniref:BTAD domain-containing putative transcriptional regulator n=1 Tax=Mycobacterium sp. pR1184 TaxID=3238981 RepID=UPI00351B2135